MLTKQAQQLLEAAEAAQAGGQPLTHFTLLVHDDGSIQLLADCDWPLESLASHHGARAVYRVAEVKGKIQVEGRAGLRTCLLQSVSPLASSRFVFATQGLSTRRLPA